MTHQIKPHHIDPHSLDEDDEGFSASGASDKLREQDKAFCAHMGELINRSKAHRYGAGELKEPWE